VKRSPKRTVAHRRHDEAAQVPAAERCGVTDGDDLPSGRGALVMNLPALLFLALATALMVAGFLELRDERRQAEDVAVPIFFGVIPLLAFVGSALMSGMAAACSVLMYRGRKLVCGASLVMVLVSVLSIASL
jgi:hypothetical protein